MGLSMCNKSDFKLKKKAYEKALKVCDKIERYVTIQEGICLHKYIYESTHRCMTL